MPDKKQFKSKFYPTTKSWSLPQVSAADWDTATRIAESLPLEHQQDFRIKISRKNHKDLTRSFIFLHTKQLDHTFNNELYALSRGTFETEGILGQGSDAIAKIALSQFGKIMVYRSGCLNSHLNAEAQQELDQITDTIRISASTLPSYERHLKARELQPLYKGITLESHLLACCLTSSQAIKLITMLANEIKSLHHYNWIHNDISSDNIIVDSDSNGKILSVKIIDFGDAIKLDVNNRHKLNNDLIRFIITATIIIRKSELNSNVNLMQWLSELHDICYLLRKKKDMVEMPAPLFTINLDDFVERINNHQKPLISPQ